MKPHPFLPLLTVLALGATAFAEDGSAIKAPLKATGDADAVGLAVASLKSKRAEFIVKVGKLDAAKTFAVEVDSVIEGSLTTDRAGKGSARFVTPAKNGAALLDFDPRGKLVRVLDGTTSVLEGIVSGTGEEEGVEVDEKVDLAKDDAPDKAKSKARYSVDRKGRRTFRVDVANVTGGPFKVLVAGVERGSITLKGKAGSLTFENPQKKPTTPLLDFDPRGEVVEILEGTTVRFSDKLEAESRGVNVASPSLSEIVLSAVSAPNGSSAKAKLRIDQRARKHFSVEIEGVAVGSYDLKVDGATPAVGTLVVATGATRAEIEFTSGDDSPGELPLTFDPVGKTLSIVQGATKFFEGVFNPNLSGAGTPSSSEPASEFEEILASTGLDADASAKAKYKVDAQGRHSFSVEIEKVDLGAYTLTVGGTVRGTITAKSVAGQIKGELEFESESEPGKKVLTFDPRGQTIEISNASGVLFSHLLGSGSATGGGGQVTPFDLTVALTSSGADSDATAKAETEANRYCSAVENVVYLGFVSVYYLPEDTVGEGTEIYSLMRDSDLSDTEYLTRFHDEGHERWLD